MRGGRGAPRVLVGGARRQQPGALGRHRGRVRGVQLREQPLGALGRAPVRLLLLLLLQPVLASGVERRPQQRLLVAERRRRLEVEAQQRVQQLVRRAELGGEQPCVGGDPPLQEVPSVHRARKAARRVALPRRAQRAPRRGARGEAAHKVRGGGDAAVEHLWGGGGALG